MRRTDRAEGNMDGEDREKIMREKVDKMQKYAILVRPFENDFIKVRTSSYSTHEHTRKGATDTAAEFLHV